MYFSNTCRENSNLTRITCTLHEDLCAFMISQSFHSFLCEMHKGNFVDKIKTHILHSVIFFRKSYCLWGNAEKIYRAGQVTDENVAHAHDMLDI